MKAKKRLEKNDVFQSIVDQLDVTLQSLSYSQGNGLTDGVKQLYEKLNADQPKISEKAKRLAANLMTENTLSADQAIIEKKTSFSRFFQKLNQLAGRNYSLSAHKFFRILAYPHFSFSLMIRIV